MDVYIYIHIGVQNKYINIQIHRYTLIHEQTHDLVWNVYMYIHIYVHTHSQIRTHTHTRTHISTHVYICIYAYLHICICVCVYIYIYIYKYIYIYIYIYICLYMYLYIYIFTYVYVDICIYIYTYIHMHAYDTYINVKWEGEWEGFRGGLRAWQWGDTRPVAMCCSVRALQHTATPCNTLHGNRGVILACRRVLQCYRVLQCVAVCWARPWGNTCSFKVWFRVTHCNALRHTVTYCDKLTVRYY